MNLLEVFDLQFKQAHRFYKFITNTTMNLSRAVFSSQLRGLAGGIRQLEAAYPGFSDSYFAPVSGI